MIRYAVEDGTGTFTVCPDAIESKFGGDGEDRFSTENFTTRGGLARTSVEGR